MSDIHEKARVRAYYMFLDNKYSSDEERYLKALEIEEKKTKCTICDKSIVEYSKKEKFEFCNIAYCGDCIHTYILSKKLVILKCISYKDIKINCPSPKCPGDCISLKQLFPDKKYLDYVTIREYKPSKCILDECNGILYYDCGSEVGRCQLCGMTVCGICNEGEHDGECDFEDLKAIEDMIQVGGLDTKQCPNCNTQIFKDGGCPSMFCWECSTFFDWDTLEENDEYEENGNKIQNTSYYKRYERDIRLYNDAIYPNELENYSEFEAFVEEKFDIDISEYKIELDDDEDYYIYN